MRSRRGRREKEEGRRRKEEGGRRKKDQNVRSTSTAPNVQKRPKKRNKTHSPHLSSEWNTLPSKYDVLTVIFFDGVQNISFGRIGILFPGRHFLLSGTTSDVVLG
jgi:hypothetical protein